MRLLKNKKGMTLIETIIALAVLGIVAAPLLAVFTSAAGVVRMTDERLEINAITRIIKENVMNSVKYGGGNTIETYDLNDPDGVDLSTEIDGYNLKVIGSEGEVYEKYKFDAERTKDFGELTISSGSAITLADTCEYMITLKTIDGKIIQKLRILVNKIPD